MNVQRGMCCGVSLPGVARRCWRGCVVLITLACRFGVGKLNDEETKGLEEMKVQLAGEIKKGNDWTK